MLQIARPHLQPMPLAPLADRLRSADAAALHRLVEEILDHAKRTEPVVRALLPEDGRTERLRHEVAALVEHWPDPASRPSLFGVPVGIKDIIAVDGLPTRAGSALPAEAFAMLEAAVVRRLREAGALILAKTVTTEFASMSPGGTANPHDPRYTPGGSSSGSTAGLAAGYFALSVGTQTAGSVIRPAAFCGVVGFKPSYGRIPVEGVLPHSVSLDTLGIFTTDVEGVTLAASALLDGWRGTTEAGESGAPVTVAVPDGAYLDMTSPEGREAFEETVAPLAETGVRVLRVPFLDDVDEVLDRHRVMQDAEFAAEHAERFARWGPLFSGGGAEQVDRGRRVSAEQLEHARLGREELRHRVSDALDEVGADAFVCPSAPGPAPAGLRSTGDPRMNAPWTQAGVPAISLPAGTVDGLPVGLQVVGRFGDDEELLGVASALERLVALD